VLFWFDALLLVLVLVLLHITFHQGFELPSKLVILRDSFANLGFLFLLGFHHVGRFELIIYQKLLYAWFFPHTHGFRLMLDFVEFNALSF
jgi:hypothetical protein